MYLSISLSDSTHFSQNHLAIHAAIVFICACISAIPLFRGLSLASLDIIGHVWKPFSSKSSISLSVFDSHTNVDVID
jgi:hypothetical protein